MNYKKILYIITLCFFALLICLHFFSLNTIREGARTLPRPVINEYINNNKSYEDAPLPPYYGESLNKMIDRHILEYFDKLGFPYTDTIELYVNYVTSGGVLTIENKRKLNDIGYYLINHAIPNIQTGNKPNPIQSWPPIKWTNDPTFNLQIQPTPTYKIYNGQSWGSLTNGFNSSSSSSSSGEGGEGSSEGKEDSSSGEGKEGKEGKEGSSNTKCGKGKSNKCRISCPSNCLDGVAAAWEEQEKTKENENENNNGKDDVWTISDWFTSKQTNIPGVSSLSGGSNVLIIGSQEVDGYQITDIDVPIETPSTLNSKIDDFIKYYFIESGSDQGKPTQEAIDSFNTYFKDKTPMDDIHMNKLRDVVYYIMQIIIPGLPVNETPRAYVEWRPIKWLSRSEK
jgi:hypothetical protein